MLPLGTKHGLGRQTRQNLNIYAQLTATKNSRILPDFFSPFTVIVIFVVLALLGMAATPLLNFRLHPSAAGTEFYISYNYFGASAEAVEMEATAPLEGVLATIEGVEEVSSVSGDGWGRITTYIDRHANMQKVRFMLVSAIREVYPRLPDGVSYPNLSTYSAREERMVQLLVYTVAASIDPPAIKEIANELILPKLSLINGVSRVDVYGANVNDWYIEYIPHKLEQLGISPNSIAQAIAKQGYSKGVGATLNNQGLSIPVSLVGQGISPKEWGSIPVAMVSGRVITLEQVATVQLRQRDPDGYFRINGKNAVNIVIQSTTEANQLATANEVYKTIEHIETSLPQGFNLQKSYDSTTQLRTDLNRNIQRTAISLLILLLFVLVASRSFRYLMVVGISLVINLAIAVLLYYALGLEIHLYSLSGITLSLGLIIDNTLVVVDHLRHRRNLLVFTALLAATFTTIGALASIFFLEEEQRRNLTDFAWVIIVNLTVSLAIALFLIPSIIDRVKLTSQTTKRNIRGLRRKAKMVNLYARFSLFLNRHKRIVLTIAVLIVGIPIFWLPDKIEKENRWAKAYNATIGSHQYQNSIKPYAEKFLGGTLRLFYNSVWEKSYWGVPERTRVFVNYNLAQGGTLEQTNALAELFESHIVVHPEVEQAISTIRERNARIEIYFTPQHENGAFPYRLKAEMEQLAITQAGADFSIYGVGRGFSNATGYNWANSQILLTGYSHQQIMKWARLFADSLQTIPRVDKVWIRGGYAYSFSDDFRRYLRVDEQQLMASGVGLGAYTQMLQRNAPTSDISQWLPINNRQMAVRIRPQGEIVSDFMLQHSPMRIGEKEVRTHAVGTITNEMVGEQIYKYNQEYIVTLAYNFIGPDKLVARVLDEQIEKINSKFPVGFKASKRGYGWWSKDTQKQYYMLGVMLAIIFFASSILFESLKQPLAIVIIIPLSFVGVFLTYSLFDLSFDQGTFAAFLLLGGLVVNSAIYILDEMNALQKRFPNASPISCYMRALNIKIVPILLTVISTVLGLLPFVMFGEEPFWFSLAAGTIGGLLFSIPAILLFLPLLPGVLGRSEKRKRIKLK